MLFCVFPLRCACYPRCLRRSTPCVLKNYIARKEEGLLRLPYGRRQVLATIQEIADEESSFSMVTCPPSEWEPQEDSKVHRWMYGLSSIHGSLEGIKEKRLLAAFPEFPLFQAMEHETNHLFDIYHNPRKPSLNEEKVDAVFYHMLRIKTGGLPLTQARIFY